MLLYSLTATVMTQARIMDAIVTNIAKQPTEYLATNQKSEPKQKSWVLTKSATRKLARVSRPIVVRHIVTVHLPRGSNGFFLSPLSASSIAKTSWVYGTINNAANISISFLHSQACLKTHQAASAAKPKYTQR